MARKQNGSLHRDTAVPGTGALALKPIQVAAMLSVGRTSVYRLIDAGKLHAIRVGSDYRITRKSVDDFLASAGE